MGKQIYLTDKEAEFLERELSALSENVHNWDTGEGGSQEGEDELLDRIREKLEK